MKLVGIVSDTHGLFDNQLQRLFSPVNAILHAGDVCGQSVLTELSQLAPVEAIHGKRDHGTNTDFLPPYSVVSHHGWRILLLYQLGKPEHPRPEALGWIQRYQPDIIVSGHSLRAFASSVNGILFLNPGSAGKKRFRLARSAMLLRLTEHEASVAIHSLDDSALPRIQLFQFTRASQAKGA